jgi:hypothetical protein
MVAANASPPTAPPTKAAKDTLGAPLGLRQPSEPPSLLWPSGHATPTGVVDPAGQKCPGAAAHGAQDSEPSLAENLPTAQGDAKKDATGHSWPGGHTSSHSTLRAVSPLYLPGAHAVQSPVPPGLCRPRGQTTLVRLVLPAGQAYPGEQAPVHAQRGHTGATANDRHAPPPVNTFRKTLKNQVVTAL